MSLFTPPNPCRTIGHSWYPPMSDWAPPADRYVCRRCGTLLEFSAHDRVSLGLKRVDAQTKRDA